MRFRHILSETRAGLRQNLTMTLAVIMTMWVSLSLFGAGLLASQQVNLMKGNGTTRSRFRSSCAPRTPAATSVTRVRTSPRAQKDEIRRTLEANPEVAPGGIYFETKQDAYAEFQKV